MTTSILLLEDLPSFGAHFTSLFGADNVTTVATVEELRVLLQGDQRWDYAFVDFSLGRASHYTGLSAMADLGASRPRTRLVGFTSVGDPSRPMFAVAAFRWLGMWGLMNKADANSGALLRVVTGNKPLSPSWERKLRENAHLLDRLFASPEWGRYWQLLQEANGTAEGLARLTPGGPSKSAIHRSFILKVEPEVRNFANAFISSLNLAAKPQPMLVDFWRENATFFEAPDLLQVLARAEPWKRIAD